MIRKSPKPLFADRKSTALVVGVVVLLLISGIITSKTLRPDTLTEDGVSQDVNASFRDSGVNMSSRTPDVSAPVRHRSPSPRDSVTSFGNPM
jgi:hypothetical protein